MKSNKSRQNIVEDIPYFYSPDIIEQQQLSGTEAQHAFKVLRLRVGAEIRITDGKGHLYSAILCSNSLSQANLSNIRLIDNDTLYRPKLHIAIAPTKNMDRLEFALEKLTEVGVEFFSIVITEHTIRDRINMERLQKIMVSAMKQSRKLVATKLQMYNSLSEFLETDLPKGRYIGYCGDYSVKTDICQSFEKNVDSCMLIGPEGDFTMEEVQIASKSGFNVVSLGKERLRTETAAIYAGFVHHIMNNCEL